MRRLPILKWMPVYNWKENLIPDTISGMMLAIQQVTQGTVDSFQIRIFNLIMLDFSALLSLFYFFFLFDIIVKL